MVLVACLAVSQGAVLDRWEGRWSPYRVVDDSGVSRRLLKGMVELPGGAGWELVLRDGAGELDREVAPPGRQGLWAHGFWAPEGRTSGLSLELEVQGKPVERRALKLPAPGGPPALPLRLDRLDRGLWKRLEEREAGAVPPPAADVVSYLRRHEIVYLRPSESWVEGLPLGNGDVGALVSGRAGREQVFYLDKTDLWYNAPDGTALGRSWAGSVRVRYRTSGRFEQRLSLGKAEVVTADGAFRSLARVHASRNVFELELEGAPAEIEVERQPVTLWVDRSSGYKNASRLFGSWAKVTSPDMIARLRQEAESAPRTEVTWGQSGSECWFVNRAPNLRYAVVLKLDGGKWKPGGKGCLGSATGRLQAAIATDRESPDPLSAARRLLRPADAAAHREWWRRFWSRSWIELPDKLEEQLWYIGLYQQASCSRSEQAVSFFGLWHPLDHRTWYDAYVTDAQVPMIWWLCFGANHLELLYPSHRTFGRMAREFVRRTPGEGMVTPHSVHPEWAGGNEFFSGSNTHKGSSAWFSMNFWWDYLYSGDTGFLREVTYPLLRMSADYLAATMLKEPDGRYHITDSGSPEQDETDRDNLFDWAMATFCLRAAIRASETLGVDAGQRGTWRERLEKLYLPPGDGETLWEAPNNPHPYRCHPVVLFGLHPTNAIPYGSPLMEAARRTVPVVTRLLGYRYEDRHATIPNFLGGVEPNGFSSGILTINAARLGGRALYRRFLYGLIVRFHLKQNGLRALIDTRQSDDISRSSLVEAANAHTVAITETLVQSWDDHVRLFPCIEPRGRVRFAGLRAAEGFVISAEARDGVLRWARVLSLKGGKLKLAAPGLEREFETRPGEVVSVGGEPDLGLPAGEAPAGPRAIPLPLVENPGERLLHYPEDLPFGQVVEDGNLYLGRPARPGAPAAAPEREALLRQARAESWEDRQEAARLLCRLGPVPGVLEELDRLCGDSSNVVAHTAVVSLVRLRTPESLAIARRHAQLDRVAGLRREVEKALKRLRVER